MAQVFGAQERESGQFGLGNRLMNPVSCGPERKQRPA